jgi:hypothetical protein
MASPEVPDSLEMGHLTQIWLAMSHEPAAKVSGRYWHHHCQQTPARELSDFELQAQLVTKLTDLSGISLF